MPVPDQDFLAQLRATFNIEAAEHLQAISAHLLELEKSPPADKRQAAIEIAYREAHSLKGASRAVDLREIEQICQKMESIFADWKRQSIEPPREVLDILHNDLNEMSRLLGGAGTEQAPSAAFRAESAGVPHDIPDAASGTVRIPATAMDARLAEVEEMLLVKSSVRQRAADLRQMTALFDEWWKQWANISSDVRAAQRQIEQEESSQSQHAGALPKSLIHFIDWNYDYVRSLQAKIAGLAQRAEQDRHGTGKRVDDLLYGTKKLLMLPFSTIAQGFPKVVRDLCREQKKEADLILRGSEISLDKRILEEIKDPLIHILRNCIDHGIETTEARAKANKSPRAMITVALAAASGNSVEIVISDDGGGIDVSRVKEAAMAQGILSPTEARALSDRDASALILRSGLSTSAGVTDISGRGLGMAIVASTVEKLGGKIAIENHAPAGTIFRLTLPLTLTTFRGIVVSVADRLFVIPTASVERVLRIKREAIKNVENRQTILLGERATSLTRLQNVLELQDDDPAGDSPYVVAVVLRLGEERIAFAVDQVLREDEVLVKPFRRPLVRVRNIAGATVLGSGKTAPVLHVPDLMKSAQSRPAPAPSAGATEAKAPTKKILVVEDSITSRMLLKGILESADYSVKTAVDGIDAFTILREEAFDLLISDVEMPRLNGLDLTARIRADKKLAELPIILVTALESRSERERGIDVGASAYLVKSSFDQSNLLEAVRRLIGAA